MKKILLLTILCLLFSLIGYSQIPLGGLIPYPTKTQVNTELDKKISIADSEAATNNFVPKVGGSFSGAIKIPTASAGTADSTAASTAFVKNEGYGKKIFPISGGTYGFPYTSPAVTTEETVITFTIPTESIGTWGSIHMILEASCVNTAVVKTVRVKMNGTQVSIMTLTSVTGGRYYLKWDLQGVLNGNIECTNYAAGSGLFTTSGSLSFSERAVDFSSAVTVTITCQTASASELITIRSCPTFIYY